MYHEKKTVIVGSQLLSVSQNHVEKLVKYTDIYSRDLNFKVFDFQSSTFLKNKQKNILLHKEPKRLTSPSPQMKDS